MIKIHGSSGIEFPNNYSIKSDSGDLTVMNDVNKLWEMNSAGHESKPNIPGFHVANGSSWASDPEIQPDNKFTGTGEHTPIEFYTIVHTDGYWDPTKDNQHYTVNKAGKYLIYANARFDGLTNYSRMYIEINNVAGWWSPGIHSISNNSAFNYFTHSIQGVLHLYYGDTIRLKGGGSDGVGLHQGEGCFGMIYLG